MDPPGRRVLLIEDHDDAAQALCLSLRRHGHTVAMAPLGEQGIEMALSFAPDVIVCDLGLPDIDGLEVARRIRSDPQLKGVWLIALTAYFVPELALEAGFDEYMTKPADLQKLALHLNEPPPTR